MPPLFTPAKAGRAAVVGTGVVVVVATVVVGATVTATAGAGAAVVVGPVLGAAGAIGGFAVVAVATGGLVVVVGAWGGLPDPAAARGRVAEVASEGAWDGALVEPAVLAERTAVVDAPKVKRLGVVVGTPAGESGSEVTLLEVLMLEVVVSKVTVLDVFVSGVKAGRAVTRSGLPPAAGRAVEAILPWPSEPRVEDVDPGAADSSPS